MRVRALFNQFSSGLAVKILTAGITIILLTLINNISAYAMTVVLDPGHGGEGTSGSGAIYAPFVEKSLNLTVAAKTKEELEEAGFTVYLTHEDDRALSLEERAAYAASVNADILVSIHFNSSGPHDKFGSEVWTSLFSPYFDEGIALGSSILKEITSLGYANKGVKTRAGSSGDYYGIIRHGISYGIPTVIVEHCFIDHPYDRMLLYDTGVDDLAHADAQGIINYARDSKGIEPAYSDNESDLVPESSTDETDFSRGHSSDEGSGSYNRRQSTYKEEPAPLVYGPMSVPHSSDETALDDTVKEDTESRTATKRQYTPVIRSNVSEIEYSNTISRSHPVSRTYTAPK